MTHMGLLGALTSPGLGSEELLQPYNQWSLGDNAGTIRIPNLGAVEEKTTQQTP